MLRIITVKDKMILAYSLKSVRTYLKNSENTLKSDPAFCISVNDISSAVIIPERTRIDKSLTFKDKLWSLPLPKRVLSPYNVVTLIRHSVINVEHSLVESDSRSPDSLGMPRDLKSLLPYVFEGIINQAPVHKVF